PVHTETYTLSLHDALPIFIMAKLKALMSHTGSWAPMAEQVATAAFLNNEEAVEKALTAHKKRIEERLWLIHNRIEGLKAKGYPIDAIADRKSTRLNSSHVKISY